MCLATLFSSGKWSGFFIEFPGFVLCIVSVVPVIKWDRFVSLILNISHSFSSQYSGMISIWKPAWNTWYFQQFIRAHVVPFCLFLYVQPTLLNWKEQQRPYVMASEYNWMYRLMFESTKLTWLQYMSMSNGDNAFLITNNHITVRLHWYGML